MVRFHRGDVVQQFKIEFFDQFVECAGSHIGAHFSHHEVNGRGGMLSILCDGCFNPFSGIVEIHRRLLSCTGVLIQG